MTENVLKSFNIGYEEKRLKAPVNVHSIGITNIYIHGIKKETFENIAKASGKEIQEFQGTIWIQFAKARDGSTTFLIREK